MAGLKSDVEEESRSGTSDRKTPVQYDDEQEEKSLHSPLSHRFRKSSRRQASLSAKQSRESSVAVLLSRPSRSVKPSEGDKSVKRILAERKRPAGVNYNIQLANGREEEVSLCIASSSSLVLYLCYIISRMQSSHIAAVSKRKYQALQDTSYMSSCWLVQWKFPHGRKST